jgi:hypothetical protein
MPDSRHLGLTTMLDQSILGLACQQQMMCRLVCLGFSYYDGQKIRAYALLSQKPLLQPVFDTKHPKNNDKLIHGLKKQKKT